MTDTSGSKPDNCFAWLRPLTFSATTTGLHTDLWPLGHAARVVPRQDTVTGRLPMGHAARVAPSQGTVGGRLLAAGAVVKGNCSLAPIVTAMGPADSPSSSGGRAKGSPPNVASAARGKLASWALVTNRTRRVTKPKLPVLFKRQKRRSPSTSNFSRPSRKRWPSSSRMQQAKNQVPPRSR